MPRNNKPGCGERANSYKNTPFDIPKSRITYKISKKIKNIYFSGHNPCPNVRNIVENTYEQAKSGN